MSPTTYRHYAKSLVLGKTPSKLSVSSGSNFFGTRLIYIFFFSDLTYFFFQIKRNGVGPQVLPAPLLIYGCVSLGAAGSGIGRSIARAQTCVCTESGLHAHVLCI